MEGQKVEEFQDWEEVQLSLNSDLVNSPKSMRSFEDDSQGLIRLDHFSLEKDGLYAKAGGEVSELEGTGLECNDPGWIDPGSGELWSDLGSDLSEDKKVGVFEVKNEMGFVEKMKGEVGFEGVGGIEGKEDGKGGQVESFEDKFREFGLKSEMGYDESLERRTSLESFDGTHKKGDDLAKLWTESSVDGLVLGDVSSVNEELAEGEGGNVLHEGNLTVAVAAEETKHGSEEKRKIVWWKVPFEMLKCCVFKISPVWSFSVAAAVVGFVILGRRLYKMKHKVQSMHLKVTVDDKKVSQVMSRAARLNEAFTMVRRVPVVRPLLPPAGLNPWPAMTLR